MGGALLAAPAFSPLAAPSAAADEADAAYGLTFDAAGLFSSPAGRMVVDRIRQCEPGMDACMAGLTDTLGMDVTTDLGVVSLTSDRDDLSDMTLMADLGKSSGKLEGWMLTLPGYDSEDLNDQTLLHGFDVTMDCGDGAQCPTVRVFAAMPQTRDGGYCLVASTKRTQTLAMATDAAAAANPLADANHRLDGGKLIAMSVGRLPAKLLEETADQPGAAVWKAIQGMQFSIASGERFRADLAVVAATPARGRQLKQLLGGLSAVAQLMASSDDHPAAGEAASILNDLSMTDRTDGTPGVEIRVDIPQTRLEGWVDRGVIPAIR